MKKEHLALLLLVSLAAYALFLTTVPAAWLERPSSAEIYVTGNSQTETVVYSSEETPCTLCGKEKTLQKGENTLGTEECRDSVLLTCGGLLLNYSKETMIAKNERTPAPQKSPDLLFLSVLLLSLSCVVLWKGFSMSLEFFCLALGGVSVAFITAFHARALGFEWLVFPALCALLAFLFFRNKHAPGQGKKQRKPPARGARTHEKRSPLHNANTVGLGLSLMLVLYVLFLNIFVSDANIWGSYYYRHAQTAFEKQTVFYEDEFSYMGRPFTYPPGFFEWGAAWASLAGADSFEAVRLGLHLLVVFWWSASAWLLFKKYGLRERVLAWLLLISTTFVLTTLGGVALHIVAYALFNTALLLLEANLVFSSLVFAASFATHPTVLFMLPFYALAQNRFELEREWVAKAAAVGFLGVVLSLPFFVPIFMSAGLPYEIVPSQWGYLLSYGAHGFVNEWGMLVPVMLLALAGAYRNPVAWLVALLMLANIIVSFRANVLLGITLAGFAPIALHKELEDKTIFALLLLFPLANLLVFPGFFAGGKDWCTWSTALPVCITPYKYVDAHTEVNAVVGTNPLFGHNEAYYGKRRVLADLYVEYADEDKYGAEAEAYWNGNYTRAEKYNVSVWVVDDLYGNNRTAPGNRVFDNGVFHVYVK